MSWCWLYFSFNLQTLNVKNANVLTCKAINWLMKCPAYTEMEPEPFIITRVIIRDGKGWIIYGGVGITILIDLGLPRDNKIERNVFFWIS